VGSQEHTPAPICMGRRRDWPWDVARSDIQYERTLGRHSPRLAHPVGGHHRHASKSDSHNYRSFLTLMFLILSRPSILQSRQALPSSRPSSDQVGECMGGRGVHGNGLIKSPCSSLCVIRTRLGTIGRGATETFPRGDGMASRICRRACVDRGTVDVFQDIPW
jgi:hypothetical protein